MALGTPSGLALGDAVRLLENEVLGTLVFASGVTAPKLEVFVDGGVVTSGFVVFGAGEALAFSVADLSGRAKSEEIIAGSTGAPLTVAVPVGGRLAGGVYLLLDVARGGKSCLRTPLYLKKS